jgi:hypothetical protein
MTASTASRSASLTEQDVLKLAAVYLDVVRNWAVYAEDIVKHINDENDPRYTNTNTTAVNGELRQRQKLGLVVGTHVNGEKPLTWQSYFDIQNGELEEDAVAAFTAAVAPLLVPGSKAPRVGATGARYTEEQIAKGLRARARGESNKAVAEAAGVKSPNYFAKTLKAVEAAKSAKTRANKKAGK